MTKEEKELEISDDIIDQSGAGMRRSGNSQNRRSRRRSGGGWFW